MGSKNRKSILTILKLKKEYLEKKIFHFDKCIKWIDLTRSGYRTEGHVGSSQCKYCGRNKICVYRVYIETSRGVEDELRFEQEVEDGSGRVVLTTLISTEWQGMRSRMEREFVREKWSGERGFDKTHGRFDVIKKQFFADVQCVACKGMLETFHQIVKVDGEKKFRWFLAIAKQGTVDFSDEDLVFDEKKDML
jgi:hypothetical protein